VGSVYGWAIKALRHTEHHRKKLRAEGQPAVARYLAIEDKHYAEGRGGMNHVFEATIEFTTQDGRSVRSTGQLIANRWETPSPGDRLHIRYDPADPDDWTWCNEDDERDGSFGGVQVVNASGADRAEIIEKLERLREQGLVTDQQLAAARSQIPTGATQAANASTDTIAERLRKLDQLRAQQLLSDEEYAQQRQRVLDSI
jgi:hypothetical protein